MKVSCRNGWRSGSGSHPGRAPRRDARAEIEPLIYDLLGSSILLPEDWDQLSLSDRDRLYSQPDRESALSFLVEVGLLTPYQSICISTGNTFGLVLGNFRMLERLGAGGMAVVYKAEHIEMRHLVAIKVLHFASGDDPRLETRFSAEMRAVARLRHPNIVAAIDAGRAYSPDPNGPVLWYLVMEYVPGEDLDAYVRSRGPLSVASACNLIHQVACALAETHKLGMVHRDIKPSNILVTPEEQAKLLDFGLSRHTGARMTQPGTVLGTVDYMAPEQARDASSVDVRADIFSLGGTLYWCLTGQVPFPTQGSEVETLLHRLTQQPPSVRSIQPGLPLDLDAVVQRMMALDPEDRYSTPQEVMHALLAFLEPPSSEWRMPPLEREGHSAGQGAHVRNLGTTQAMPHPRVQGPLPSVKRRRVLIVDDDSAIRQYCQEVLRLDELVTDEAASGDVGLARAHTHPPDLALIDVNMPGLSGPELLRRLRINPPTANLKVIMFSGQASGDEMSRMLLAGADDYLTKPFSVPQLLGRVQSALRLKEAQDRSDMLNQHLLVMNERLERNLSDRDSDLAQVRQALVLALARLVQVRENDSGRHLERISRYVEVLAEEAARQPSYQEQIDQAFIDMLKCCAPLHDIGKVGLPDHILLKPGKLQPEERMLMQAHTTVLSDMLTELAQTYGAAQVFLRMASEIIRHHHERFDGTGYPDRLAGAAIPLAARIVSLVDVYDALRSRRSYKPALSHQAAVGLILESATGQFDPVLVEAFSHCAGKFEKIFCELPG